MDSIRTRKGWRFKRFMDYKDCEYCKLEGDIPRPPLFFHFFACPLRWRFCRKDGIERGSHICYMLRGGCVQMKGKQ